MSSIDNGQKHPPTNASITNPPHHVTYIYDRWRRHSIGRLYIWLWFAPPPLPLLHQCESINHHSILSWYSRDVLSCPQLFSILSLFLTRSPPHSPSPPSSSPYDSRSKTQRPAQQSTVTSHGDLRITTQGVLLLGGFWAGTSDLMSDGLGGGGGDKVVTVPGLDKQEKKRRGWGEVRW